MRQGLRVVTPSRSDPGAWLEAADPAHVFLTGPGVGTLTYRALRDRVRVFAAALALRGVGVGDRVLVQVEKSVDALVLYLAALHAGAVYVPLNPAYTASELGYFLSDAEPRLTVLGPKDGAVLAPLVARVGALETLGADGEGSLPALAAGAGAPPPRVQLPAESLAALVYTSGTTGRSKGAMLTRGNLASNAVALVAAWRFTGADVLLHALPLFHVHGLFAALNTVLAAGAGLRFHARFDAAAVLAELPAVTTLMGVPTFYTRLLQLPALDARACAGVRLFISGSAPLLPETHEEFRTRTGHSILERYGMTETLMNTSNPYEGERRPGSVGRPLAGIALRLTQDGRELPTGETGMIELKGPNVFAGYWRDPDKTREAFTSDGYFVTGDLGIVDTAGNLAIVGRAKDLVISGGYNVYPREVEAALDRLPGVAESAVIGLAHADLGEGVTAVIVARPGASPAEGEIILALKDVLAGYKVPKRVLVVPELPRNAMGKVQKAELRRRFGDLYR
jgi:malonyl-CoA/methylmalonyl-CoA synthetase